MKSKVVLPLILIFLLSSLSGSLTLQTTTSDNFELSQNNPQGVVVLDDMHSNDYSEDGLTEVENALKDEGYIVRFSSSFDSWHSAVSVANYLVISAPYSDLSSSEIESVEDWFESGSRNLLIASRGDFEVPSYSSINSLLSALGATSKAQHDNVYTTNPSASNPWYVDTTNFNTSEYPALFNGVEVVNFFSPSSIEPGNADVIIRGDARSYQTNQNGDPPEVIFDDSDDDTGGEAIPLATYEEVNLGSEQDHIITIGTTMWSDFDYSDTSNDDTIMFSNFIKYFREQTIEDAGSIEIELSDENPPEVDIFFPRSGSIVKGIVQIETRIYDPFGVENVEIFIDGEKVASSDTYSWDTTKYDRGTHDIRVVALDEAGNKGEVSYSYIVYQEYEPWLNAHAKFMTYNIKESGIFPQWRDVVKEENPDVLILVETGDFDDDNDKLLKEYQTEFNNYFQDEIEYDVSTLQNIGSAFNGISLYSRFDITSTEKLSSLTADNGTTVNIPLPFLHSTIDIGGNEVHIIGGHLSAFPEAKAERKSQQEGIINYMDNLGDVPIIYAGDMNSESSADTSDNGPDDLGTEPIDMIINTNHPLSSEVHTFIDVQNELNDDIENTFIGSTQFASRIDYIFVNQHFNELLMDSTTGDTKSAKDGSDHLPVDVTIDLTSLGIEYQQLPASITDPDAESTEEGVPAPVLVSSVVLSILMITTMKIAIVRKSKE